jgi:hypothetical protein
MVRLLGYNVGFIKAFGIIGVALFVWGVFTYLCDMRYGLRTYVLPAFTIGLGLFLHLVYPRYFRGPDILYERGWLYLGLFMAILAGYGVAFYFRSIPSLFTKLGIYVPLLASRWTHVLLLVLGIGILIAALATGLVNEARRFYASYYRMVNEQIYADFVWLGEHGGSEGRIVIMRPDLAWAYPPIAGPGTLTWATIASPSRSPQADKFNQILATGNVETEWLRRQGAWMVYTCLPTGEVLRCKHLKNKELPEVRPHVYFFPAE